MTDLPTVRATGPADLLALVPGFLGFHPEDSVVLVTVGDARQPFHARVDLPTDPVSVEELTSYLSRVAVRSGVRTVAVARLLRRRRPGRGPRRRPGRAAVGGGRRGRLRGAGGRRAVVGARCQRWRTRDAVRRLLPPVDGAGRGRRDGRAREPARARRHPGRGSGGGRGRRRPGRRSGGPRRAGARGRPLGPAAGAPSPRGRSAARRLRRGSPGGAPPALGRAPRRRLGRDDPCQRGSARGPLARRGASHAGRAPGRARRPPGLRGLADRQRRPRLVRASTGPSRPSRTTGWRAWSARRWRGRCRRRRGGRSHPTTSRCSAGRWASWAGGKRCGGRPEGAPWLRWPMALGDGVRRESTSGPQPRTLEPV